jgi:hypothetical protein
MEKVKKRGEGGDWFNEWIQKYFHLTCGKRNVKQSIALNWF